LRDFDLVIFMGSGSPFSPLGFKILSVLWSSAPVSSHLLAKQQNANQYLKERLTTYDRIEYYRFLHKQK
jgi:hypothetical protein